MGKSGSEGGCRKPAARSSKAPLPYPTRYRKITVKYQDQTFRQLTGTFEGFTAQIIRHEIDHCNGILI